MDFVVNCYERTYRDVLSAARLSELVAQHRYKFDSVSVLVNNVSDRADAEDRARRLVAATDLVTRVEFVADRIAGAMKITGLRPKDLKRLPHFTDCCLVAVTLAGADWLVYWDADARLREPKNWITPTLRFMEKHPEIAVGNPNNWHRGLAEREALRIDGDIAVGYGFSDVAFLTRRRDLGSAVYRRNAPAAWRYPLAHVEPIFEQRVDAWMRRTGRPRATFLSATLTHDATTGINYPVSSMRDRARRKTITLVGRLASRWSAHPAMRAWPTAPAITGAD